MTVYVVFKDEEPLDVYVSEHGARDFVDNSVDRLERSPDRSRFRIVRYSGGEEISL